MANVIEVGSEITMHMKLMLKDKSIAQNTKDDNKPIKMLVGNGYFTENFEKHLLGLKMGEKNVFMVDAKDAFGTVNPANVHVMPRSQFPKDAHLEPGIIFMFAQPNGVEVPGVIRKIQEDQVTIDFNHPLCGQDLVVEVDILAIQTPVKH